MNIFDLYVQTIKPVLCETLSVAGQCQAKRVCD